MTNNSKNAVSVLQDVIAIHLHFSTWTGRKILEENDLSLQGEAPPKEIINLGSKHTTDPAALKVFNTLKRRAERACLRKGIPFMGGYAIPVKDANEIAFYYADGFNQYDEYTQVFIEEGVVLQGGPYYSFADKDGVEVKLQGKSNLVKHFKENEEDFQLLLILKMEIL